MAFISVFNGCALARRAIFVRGLQVTPRRLQRPNAANNVAVNVRLLCMRASLTARARRRAEAAARIEAHRVVAASPRHQTTLVYVSVPREHRTRASLTRRMSRAKVFVPMTDLASEKLLRMRLRDGMAHLFPELTARGFLTTDPNDVDIAIGNNQIAHGDDHALSSAISRFEDNDGVLDNIFAELHMKAIPPPLPPLSSRRLFARKKSAEAFANASPLRMVSFYKFVFIEQPENVSGRLTKLWNDLGVLGRVYVANEGMNAQLAVPVPLWDDFVDAMSGAWHERGTPIVPDELVAVFLNRDSDVAREAVPFEKLHVRVREKVLADGLDSPLDWSRAGREVSPEEWHSVLAKMLRKKHVHDNNSQTEQTEILSPEMRSDDNEFPIVLDCRNDYESNVGNFEGSEPLGTRTFRESWDILERRLADIPRDKPIMTFCTGGIRCNKINAYLEQKMGFTNTGRLGGGIISYARVLRSQGRIQESLFKGVNHVFDGRVGEAITDDILERCINCSIPCNVQTDCANVRCPRSYEHRLFVQCPDCATRLHGACSHECHEIISANATVHEASGNSVGESGIAKPVVEHEDADRIYDSRYASTMSEAEPHLLTQLRTETEARFPNRAHMVCGSLEGALLRMLVGLTGASRVLEIGTFTGYSALMMARALPSDGLLVTCEHDEEVASVAASYFKRDEDHGEKIELFIGSARERVETMLVAGEKPFDLIFLDGDKNYQVYYDMFMSGLLRVGGLLVVDNVLFRGQVARVWAREQKIEDLNGERGESFTTEEAISKYNAHPDDLLARRRLKSLENVRKIAQRIDSFNRLVAADPRVESVVLPVRDGMTLLRRRK